MSNPVDNTLDSAEALIQLQAAVNARFIDLRWLLAKRSGIASIQSTCEVRRYQGDKACFRSLR